MLCSSSCQTGTFHAIRYVTTYAGRPVLSGPGIHSANASLASSGARYLVLETFSYGRLSPHRIKCLKVQPKSS